MHLLHDYVAKQLADKIGTRGVVVWYDERAEFAPFIEEVRGDGRADHEPVEVRVGERTARLIESTGSLFELRATVEPLVCGDKPESVVLYLPRCARDRRGSVLMELEKAGATWEPQLKQLARNLLLQRFTLGVVDELLAADRALSYQDLARAAAGNGSADPPSVLKTIFYDQAAGQLGADGLLAAWLVSDTRDEEIAAKSAVPELVKLVRARLGLALPTEAPVAKLRSITLRYVLGGEFRSDLTCPPPASLDGVPAPSSKDEVGAVRQLAQLLRTSFPEEYERLADRVEGELGLTNAPLPAGSLGSIDTFRFEERALLAHAGELIVAGSHHDALALIAAREHCFWLDRDVARKAQWEAARRMAELGTVAAEVREAVAAVKGDAAAWLAAYTAATGGWYHIDQAQRRLEAWVANLDDEPAEQPLGIVRRAYEDACQAMAAGFVRAFGEGGWAVPGALHQTRIWSEVASSRPKPCAYFLVDAMRYEMGAELAARLPASSEVSLRPAIGVLPSITPIGMAALLPGAAGSFSIDEQATKLGARIEGTFLPDLAARRKLAAARIPKLVDLALDELLSLSPSKLAKKVEGAPLVLVRSQEIDHAGEAGFTFQARQVMDTVIDNLARAIRKLASAGVEHAVVSADHGHLFLAADRDESMRVDSPGGQTVDLHRRCWIGRGGTTPPGCVRVSAAALGYSSDLELVFPSGSAVFRAGGDLAFHHGGPSLQELVVPVITVRTPTRPTPGAATAPPAGPIVASGLPAAVTNRIFSVTFALGEKQMSLADSGGATGVLVRPLLMAAGKQVGLVGMAVDAPFDRATGCVTLEPGKPVTVAFLLSDESGTALRIVVQDPATDAELYRSPTDIPVRLGV
ncbi:MAG TPA: PglZ domain-containing protein [Thermoanaerobaculia bacterium]|nr:PglZ domain-containing protein [Thermoanaerobaculia bacterium]